MSVAAQVQQAFSVALYQPDIAGNTGAILRLAACFGFQVELIGPAGFNTSERAFRRAGMDYLELARLQMHVDWAAFERWRRAHMRRLILFSTKSARAYAEFAFEPNARHTGRILGNIDEFEAIVLPKQMEAFAIHKFCDPENVLARAFTLLSKLLVNP